MVIIINDLGFFVILIIGFFMLAIVLCLITDGVSELSTDNAKKIVEAMKMKEHINWNMKETHYMDDSNHGIREINTSDERTERVILYICDKKQCGEFCPSHDCNLTDKIEHAVNFKAIKTKNGTILGYEEKEEK